MEQKLTNAAQQDEQVTRALSQPKTANNAEDEILSHAFLTIEEVAMLLRVSKRTVYNLVYKGVLPATKVTYHVTVISKQDFLDMLERNRYVRTVALPKVEKSNDSLAQHKGKKKNESNAEKEACLGKKAKDDSAATTDKTKKPRCNGHFVFFF